MVKKCQVTTYKYHLFIYYIFNYFFSILNAKFTENRVFPNFHTGEKQFITSNQSGVLKPGLFIKLSL